MLLEERRLVSGVSSSPRGSDTMHIRCRLLPWNDAIRNFVLLKRGGGRGERGIPPLTKALRARFHSALGSVVTVSRSGYIPIPKTATGPSGHKERRSPMSSSCGAILSRSLASLARSLLSDACIIASFSALTLSSSSCASLSSSSLANLFTSSDRGTTARYPT